MKHLVLSLVLLTTAQPAAGCSVCGVWEGKVHNLPGVELDIREKDGRLSGHVLFYLMHRDSGGDWKVAGSTSLEMLEVRLEGKTLTFEALHRTQHGGTVRGPNSRFRMVVREKNRAVLLKIDPPDPDVGEVALVRRVQ
jgi:hypothetical protein